MFKEIHPHEDKLKTIFACGNNDYMFLESGQSLSLEYTSFVILMVPSFSSQTHFLISSKLEGIGENCVYFNV